MHLGATDFVSAKIVQCFFCKMASLAMRYFCTVGAVWRSRAVYVCLKYLDQTSVHMGKRNVEVEQCDMKSAVGLVGKKDVDRRPESCE